MEKTIKTDSVQNKTIKYELKIESKPKYIQNLECKYADIKALKKEYRKYCLRVV